MEKIKSICVSCGSSMGAAPEYAAAARVLGGLMAERGITLVYGGSNAGLMGVIADRVLAEKGRVIGVLPRFLSSQVGHGSLSELHEVDTMHERKMKMFELADAYIVLPGGFGTLEETMEVLTWAQLGLHRKPVGFLNVENYFGHLLQFVDHAVSRRFIKKEHQSMILCGVDPENLIDQLNGYRAPQVDKWLDR
jgi:uncharacterized protein (TIGR00730 family)